MKFFLKILFVLSLFFGVGLADEVKFNKMSENPEFLQTGEGKEFCPICGMSIKHNYKTSHASVHKDGTKTQYCSIRCLVADNDAILDEVKVTDAKSEKIIDANKAFYVVGSKVKGTMSKVSKFAFENENDAKDFIKNFGGEIKTFKEAVQIAKNSLAAENAERSKMLKKKMYPKGKKIYENKCQKIDVEKFSKINKLKAEVLKSCKDIEPKKAQAVTRYLWDEVKSKSTKIKIDEKDRCAVCAMFVYKYPNFIAKISYENGEYKAFDGVKDMMKFILEPEKYGKKSEKIAKIEVSDYYSQGSIDGKTAFYVIGSDVFGPMGNELIAFADENEAKAFKSDHKASKILKFDDIDKAVICELDGFKCE